MVKSESYSDSIRDARREDWTQYFQETVIWRQFEQITDHDKLHVRMGSAHLLGM